MQLDDLTVEVRNSSLVRVGQILPADLVGSSFVPRFNKMGAWKIVLDGEHPMVDALRAPGAGIIVTRTDGSVVISGSVVSATNTKTADDVAGSWEIIGTDDSAILGERLAYPTPTTADVAAQTSDYDVRTGAAETVVKAYVNANIGPSAPAARKVSSLTVEASLGRGNTVTGNARFDKLGALAESLLASSGLGFDIEQVGTGIVFKVYQPTDRSAYVRMDVDNQRLTKSEYSYMSPKATRVIVAGQGSGVDRTFLEVSNTDSLTAESDWARRIEVFKDQRNTNDSLELAQAGEEILADGGKTVEAVSVTPNDDLTMAYGTDWGLGDKVTVVVNGDEIAQIVTEVAIVVTDSGIKVGATVGDPVVAAASDTESVVAATTSGQEARISNLERNEPATTTVDTSGLAPIADPTFTGVATAPVLRLTDTTDASLTSTGHALQIGPTAGANLIADGNELMARNNGATSTLFLQSDGGNTNLSPNGGNVLLGDASSIVTAPGSLNAGNVVARNHVLNGDFDIWQRGTSLATATNASTGYTADRWQMFRAGYVAGATCTRQTSDLTGHTYHARVQRTSGNTSTAEIIIGNYYEADYCRVLAGETVTLSFWARKGANFSGTVLNARVSAGTSTVTAMPSGFTSGTTPLTTDITLTTTWTRYTVTGTIPSNTGQWAVQFRYTPVGTAGANDYFEVSGVQLEEGSVATGFHRQNGSLQAELAACQRYYYQLSANTSAYTYFAPGVAPTASTFNFLVPLPVTMRTAAIALSFASVIATDTPTAVGGLAITGLAVDAAKGNANTALLTGSYTPGGLGQWRNYYIIANNSTAAYLGFSAEL